MYNKSHNKQLILASSSPYRKMLLERLGIDFLCISPQTDESPRSGETPAALTKRLARQKATRVASEYPQAVVIGCDQVADFNNVIVGKPGSEQIALEQLLAFSGHTVLFHSAFCVLRQEDGFISEDNVTTRVQFRKFSKEEAIRYIRLDQPLDCAGSFKSEAAGSTLLHSLESSDPTALIGLPLISLSQCLRKVGMELP